MNPTLSPTESERRTGTRVGSAGPSACLVGPVSSGGPSRSPRFESLPCFDRKAAVSLRGPGLLCAQPSRLGCVGPTADREPGAPSGLLGSQPLNSPTDAGKGGDR